MALPDPAELPELPPGADVPGPGYMPPPPPVSPSVPAGLVRVPELPGVPCGGIVGSAPPLLPPELPGQGQLHIPPVPPEPGDIPAPSDVPELPLVVPPGVVSVVGPASAPPVMRLPGVASDCAQLSDVTAINTADNKLLAQTAIFLRLMVLM